MATVAVAAMLMGTARMAWRCYFCWKMAEVHAQMRSMGIGFCAFGRPAEDETPAFKKHEEDLAVYHARLEMQYRRAAWSPWKLIPPEPPRPRM
jgi:hypothetical protein